MKERFEIYDGSAEAKKAKGKSKNLSGFHPLFTAAARRSIALDSLKIWLLLGFIVGVVTGIATGAGAVSVFLGLLIAAVIYFGFRDDVYKKVYGPEHDRGQLPLPEGMSWEEAVDRIRRGFANPDVEQVTDTADAMTFYSKKRGTYQMKNTADGLKMTILTKPSKSSKKEYLYAVFSSVLLSQVIAILYPEKISAEQVEEEKAAVRKLFGAHKMPLLIELAITAAFIAFAVYMLYSVLYSDSARSKGVSDGYFSAFPAGVTVGEVLDDFFANGTWENYEQDGVTFVHYSGECVNTQTGEECKIVPRFFKFTASDLIVLVIVQCATFPVRVNASCITNDFYHQRGIAFHIEVLCDIQPVHFPFNRTLNFKESKLLQFIQKCLLLHDQTFWR